MNEATREKMRQLVEDMVSTPERREAAQRRIRNERFAMMLWLAKSGLELELQGGEDLADLNQRCALVTASDLARGVTYFFDIHCRGRKIGHGYVCWHAGHEQPFREIDWHLNLADGTETYDLGEEVWRRARLDRQLPRHFRKGYRSHPKAVLEALDAEYELDECG